MVQRILKMLLVSILTYRKVINNSNSLYFPHKVIAQVIQEEEKGNSLQLFSQ